MAVLPSFAMHKHDPTCMHACTHTHLHIHDRLLSVSDYQMYSQSFGQHGTIIEDTWFYVLCNETEPQITYLRNDCLKHTAMPAQYTHKHTYIYKQPHTIAYTYLEILHISAINISQLTPLVEFFFNYANYISQ